MKKTSPTPKRPPAPGDSLPVTKTWRQKRSRRRIQERSRAANRR